VPLDQHRRIAQGRAVAVGRPRRAAGSASNAGVDPHTVMAFSGHLTPSMLRRYHIIDVA